MTMELPAEDLEAARLLLPKRVPADVEVVAIHPSRTGVDLTLDLSDGSRAVFWREPTLDAEPLEGWVFGFFA